MSEFQTVSESELQSNRRRVGRHRHHRLLMPLLLPEVQKV
jgi:hypothetical protein